MTKFGAAPGIASDTGYDALIVYAEAVTQSGSTDPHIVIPRLAKIEMKGASGVISFDGTGGVIKQPQLWVVRGGNQKFLKPIAPRIAPRIQHPNKSATDK